MFRIPNVVQSELALTVLARRARGERGGLHGPDDSKGCPA